MTAWDAVGWTLAATFAPVAMLAWGLLLSAIVSLWAKL